MNIQLFWSKINILNNYELVIKLCFIQTSDYSKFTCPRHRQFCHTKTSSDATLNQPNKCPNFDCDIVLNKRNIKHEHQFDQFKSKLLLMTFNVEINLKLDKWKKKKLEKMSVHMSYFHMDSFPIHYNLKGIDELIGGALKFLIFTFSSSCLYKFWYWRKDKSKRRNEANFRD